MPQLKTKARKPAPTKHKARKPAPPKPVNGVGMTKEQAELAKTTLGMIVDRVDNNAKIGRRCSVRGQAVAGWLRRGYVSEDCVFPLSELATEYGLHAPPQNLRPDKFTPALIAAAIAAVKQ